MTLYQYRVRLGNLLQYMDEALIHGCDICTYGEMDDERLFLRERITDMEYDQRESDRTKYARLGSTYTWKDLGLIK